jgi:hypothetical protein
MTDTSEYTASRCSWSIEPSFYPRPNGPPKRGARPRAQRASEISIAGAWTLNADLSDSRPDRGERGGGRERGGQR